MATATFTLPEVIQRAFAHYKGGRLDEAEKLCRMILNAVPDCFDAVHLLAILQSRNEHYVEALKSFDRALALQPNHASALANRGIALKQLGRLDEAMACYDRALAIEPVHVGALANRAIVLRRLKRFEAALADCDRALSAASDHSDTLINRGNILMELRRYDEALRAYDRAIELNPNNVELHFNRGLLLQELNRYDEALASYERALAINPDHAGALTGGADCAPKLCDWDARARFATELKKQIAHGVTGIGPFVLLHYCDDPAQHLRCAQTYIKSKIPYPPTPLWKGEKWRHDKLRIAYLSADFRQHATAFLMAELFERHDRAKFEIIGLSFGEDDNSDTRKRLIAAFDQMHNLCNTSDEDAAKFLYARQIDIAVDLKGYTKDARFGILAHRPAPIQVNYLGYPGTMGAPFIDYIIADKMVAPPNHQAFYTEKIVHLPDCYQVNDGKRRIAERTPTRREVGLPERGFVFCCFNNGDKITPDMFDIWMRLLQRVEGSALWLYQENEGARRNLRNEAQNRGIDPARVVFAARMALDKHLARYRLADLFLDTLPYNAHTTASDALWAGLPLLTCKGEAFAGRVAASILHAVGLPELVACSLAEYEALAHKLATDPALLASLRDKLKDNRNSAPLFDSERFRRNIEAAYLAMWTICQRGDAPHHFAVAPAAAELSMRQP
jgi:predicted O-linked N-acetylglucosamine transferase (SPINDLY family)